MLKEALGRAGFTEYAELLDLPDHPRETRARRGDGTATDPDTLMR